MCIDIVQIWFGITNKQTSSIFDRRICPPHDTGGVLSFHVFVKYWIYEKYVFDVSYSGEGQSIHIWAALSIKMPSTQKAQIQIILRMRRVLTWAMLSSLTSCSVHWFCKRTVKVLFSLCGCPGWSGTSLSAFARRHIFAWRGPFMYFLL